MPSFEDENNSGPGLIFEQNIMAYPQKDKFRVQYLRKLTDEKVWVPQEERPASHQTVIIFDWDDTLMYTSYQVHGRNRGPADRATAEHLKGVESAAYKLLDIAIGLGQTFIITNGAEGWVEQCVEHYMPSLRPIMKKVRVISARTAYEQQTHGDVEQWKKLAFLELARQLDSQIVTNLVSVGDSHLEHDALHLMGTQFSRKLIKTVKLQERPTPQELMKELALLVPKFRGLVEKAANLRTCLERKKA